MLSHFGWFCFQFAQQLRVAKAQQQEAVPTTEEEKKKRYKQKKVSLNFTDLRRVACVRECVWGTSRGACGGGGGREGAVVVGKGALWVGEVVVGVGEGAVGVNVCLCMHTHVRKCD